MTAVVDTDDMTLQWQNTHGHTQSVAGLHGVKRAPSWSYSTTTWPNSNWFSFIITLSCKFTAKLMMKDLRIFFSFVVPLDTVAWLQIVNIINYFLTSLALWHQHHHLVLQMLTITAHQERLARTCTNCIHLLSHCWTDIDVCQHFMSVEWN